MQDGSLTTLYPRLLRGALESSHPSVPDRGATAHMAYHTHRAITKLDGGYRLHLTVRRCQTSTCPRYHQPYRPEMEGSWALPHGEFGLDVIALVGTLRKCSHRSVPEIHQALLVRGMQIAERTVLNLLQRYEELVAVRLADAERLTALLVQQGSVILAIDGLQPDVGNAGIVDHPRLLVRGDLAGPPAPQQHRRRPRDIAA